MTREEAISFLDNTKVYVQGKSKEIQEKLFSLGFQWKFDGKKVRHEENRFYSLGKIWSYTIVEIWNTSLRKRSER